MARDVKEGDLVYVPRDRVTDAIDTPHSLVRAPVIARVHRTLTLECPFGIGQQQVPSSAVHSDVGVCIIRIGDYQTEGNLLNPLTKSIVHFLKILLPDDQLLTHYIRTPAEFYHIISTYGGAFTHFVLVGHASAAGLHFAFGVRQSAGTLAATLPQHTAREHNFITLCCHSGERTFARQFSASAACRHLVAPYGPLHGAAASQFAQTFFAHHFLEGRTFTVAFNRSRESVPGGTRFKHWRNGSLQ
jgi:hypothetical protein